MQYPASMKQHWHNLDGLRGVLALLVVLLHFGASSFLERKLHIPPLPLALAVDVFFLLSGFVLSHSLRIHHSFAQFAIKRAFRLLPVYYVVTLPSWFVAPQPLPPLWSEILIAGPFLGREPLVRSAWSICFELYLPVLAVLLPLSVKRPLVPWLLGATLVGLGACDYFVAQGASLYAVRACLGLAGGHLLYRWQPQVPIGFDVAGLQVFALIVATGFWHALAFILPVAVCVAILAGVRGGKLFAIRPVQWLAGISYTLYMVHIPVLFGMQHWLGSRVDQNPGLKLLGIGMSIPLAAALSFAVERPAMRFGARLVTGSRENQPGGPHVTSTAPSLSAPDLGMTLP